MKKVRIFSAFSIVLLIAVLCSTVTAQDNVDIIVNPNNPVSTLTRMELVQIFKGGKVSWGDGSKIVPVVQEAEVKGFFDLMDMSKRKFDKHWITVALSGGTTPPKRVSGDAGVASYVARTKNGIGYVSSGATVSEVKVVKIID